MELTQVQISEIISNYSSKQRGFVFLQPLIIDSLIFNKHKLFIEEHLGEQRTASVPDVGQP